MSTSNKYAILPSWGKMAALDLSTIGKPYSHSFLFLEQAICMSYVYLRESL